jgi:amyloid beta precursor protein binding protein 1
MADVDMGQSPILPAAKSPSTDKDQRYDRGIRIWGEEGQTALESATVCLLNASATGAEALKNLVLGGISSFAIVDDSKVSQADLGSNFMVYPNSVGKSRAQTVTDAIKELNELVEGSFVEDSVRSIIENNPGFFKSYSIVIATQLREKDAVALDAICRGFDIPVVYAKSYGLTGLIRNSVVEHRVIDSKPDNIVQDFRLGRPWPELAQLAESIDFATLDSAAHSHVPFGVILVKASLEYFKRYGVVAEEMPATSAERQAYKDIIRSWQLTMDGCPIPEENFSQALSNVSKVWGPKEVPKTTLQILNDVESVEAGEGSEPFWIVCSALKQFYDTEHALPVCPKIPDMHSSTAGLLKAPRTIQSTV